MGRQQARENDREDRRHTLLRYQRCIVPFGHGNVAASHSESDASLIPGEGQIEAFSGRKIQPSALEYKLCHGLGRLSSLGVIECCVARQTTCEQLRSRHWQKEEVAAEVVSSAAKGFRDAVDEARPHAFANPEDFDDQSSTISAAYSCSCSIAPDALLDDNFDARAGCQRKSNARVHQVSNNAVYHVASLRATRRLHGHD
eukprot:scaffold636_cov252-Pinguiococcus_pyrenoidosus.AAC.4